MKLSSTRRLPGHDRVFCISAEVPLFDSAARVPRPSVRSNHTDSHRSTLHIVHTTRTVPYIQVNISIYSGAQERSNLLNMEYELARIYLQNDESYTHARFRRICFDYISLLRLFPRIRLKIDLVKGLRC